MILNIIATVLAAAVTGVACFGHRWTWVDTVFCTIVWVCVLGGWVLWVATR